MENCYFWIDESLHEGARGIKALCEKCHKKKDANFGWFWEGSKLGYGPFDFVCSDCEHIIHKVEEKIND